MSNNNNNENNLILYKCIICNKAFVKKNSLRAHLRMHKKEEEYCDFHVKIPKSICVKFKELCKKHNTTTCHVIMTLMQACIKGEEIGVINLASPNPILINITHNFLGVPRSRYKICLQDNEKALLQRCPCCGSSKIILFKNTPFLEGICKNCNSEWLIKPNTK
ncbi:MAG: hypothetical protein ABIM21_00430 [candidate division WOR-3 bacterium]